MTLIGSLGGPGNTVNANTVQVYSINGLNPLIAPVVLVKVP